MITRRQASGGILASAALAAAPTVVVAQEPKPFDLPPPRSTGGQPLTEALKLRRSTREYSDRPLPAQVLSDLLWAAFGVNRPSGDRTAPYWRHIMVMDIYVAMADGVWLYEPKAHTLLPHMWTALHGKHYFGASNDLVGCGHMSGLSMRSICPLALMQSDDQDPYHLNELYARGAWRAVPDLRWRPCRSSRFVALAKLEPVNL